MARFYSASAGGFYAEFQPRPEDAVAITDEEHAALLAGQATGLRIVPDESGRPVLTDPVLAIPLDDFKANLCHLIDTAAEVERRKYITPGAGQAMTYQAKADEARRYALDPGDLAGFPLLSAEVGITRATLAEVAEVVGEAYSAWLFIGAAIDAARLGTKAAINAAADHAGAQAAADAVNWPT